MRISKYHKINIIELKDSNMKEEGDLILKNIKSGDFIVTMEIDGVNLRSEEFASKIDKWLMERANITFIIGGSNGIDDRVKELSNFKLSFGKNTFPHGLFRGVLLEQIYRCYRIINREPYHK